LEGGGRLPDRMMPGVDRTGHIIQRGAPPVDKRRLARKAGPSQSRMDPPAKANEVIAMAAKPGDLRS